MAETSRIAKNTLLLYLRMAVMMAISIYTSRILLATLGIDDYGIYNAVGGFVAMFHIINAAMSTATQRFISYEIGKGDDSRIARIFSTSMAIHAILGLIIVVLTETVGLWFLNAKMVFPEDRYVAANWVYQFSILTFVINVISVPYNAAIIAYEKMAAFAYVSIFEVSLKLLIVFLVMRASCDKLILYAILISTTAILIRLVYSFYVKRNIKSCRNNWKLDKNIRGEMMKFVSWNLIGSSASVAQEQGISVLLNVFFGAAINAARGVSTQVLNAINGFVGNFNLAMNPQITKSYAKGEKDDSFNLVIKGSKFSFILMLILSTPLIVEAPYILSVWLVEVPAYSAIFLRIVLFMALVDSMKYTLVALVLASGKVKMYQLTNGILSLMVVPMAYVVLLLGCPPPAALITGLVITILCHFVRLFILKRIVDFPVAFYVKNVSFKMLLLTLISFIPPILLSILLPQGFLLFIFKVLTTVAFTTIICYFFGLSSSERQFVRGGISGMLNKINSRV